MDKKDIIELIENLVAQNIEGKYFLSTSVLLGHNSLVVTMDGGMTVCNVARNLRLMPSRSDRLGMSHWTPEAAKEIAAQWNQMCDEQDKASCKVKIVKVRDFVRRAIENNETVIESLKKAMESMDK